MAQILFGDFIEVDLFCGNMLKHEILLFEILAFTFFLYGNTTSALATVYWHLIMISLWM